VPGAPTEARTIIREPPVRTVRTAPPAPTHREAEAELARATATVHFPRFKENTPDEVLEVEIPPEAYFANA